MAPWFAVNMPDIDFQDIYYYIKPTQGQVDEWDELPEQMKATYEKLGIPEAERKYLAGVTAQYESEVVYHRNREDLEAQGILFCDMDTALREYPDLVKQYFGTVIPPGDNKFAALNSAVWSGGSFIYVPPGVECEMPLQAYFRINSENAGQFERTLIIADEGAKVHYIEGCSAPVYTSDSLHSAVVEIIVKPERPRHLHDDPELVAERLQPRHQAGPGRGRGPHGVDRRQHRLEADDEVPVGRTWSARRPRARCCRSPTPAPASTRTRAPRWSTPRPRRRRRSCRSRSRKDGGITTYRGLVRVDEGAYGCKSHVQCDALILDEESREPTRCPYMEVGERDAQIGHEATVSKIARRAALLPDEPRPLAGAGDGHDRQRLHRARSPARCRWSTRSSGAA